MARADDLRHVHFGQGGQPIERDASSPRPDAEAAPVVIRVGSFRGPMIPTLLCLRILAPIRMKIGPLVACQDVAAAHKIIDDPILDLKRVGAVVDDDGKGAGLARWNVHTDIEPDRTVRAEPKSRGSFHRPPAERVGLREDFGFDRFR